MFLLLALLPFVSSLRWFSHAFPIEPIQNGFFGTIGPNLQTAKIKSLAELFTGDGVIQGVFFKNGKPTFARHVIKTHKIVANECDDAVTMFCKYALYKVGMYPYNTIGVANTALMALSKPVDENTTAVYAIYERDLPYLVHLYHNTSTIATVKKMDAFYPEIQELSGHSKFLGNIIETLDYHVFSKTVDFFQMNENLNTVLRTNTLKMRYIPIVHDFISTPSQYIVMDSPLVFQFFRLFVKKIPVVFREKLPSFFHVLNKGNNKVDVYEMGRGYYVFHYATCEEFEDVIEICAPVYENLDFSELNICGKYRKMVLDKETKKVHVCMNSELELLNLDFPIKTGDGKIVLRNIENKRVNGFVMVDGLTIVKKWFYDDVFFMGEHVVMGDVLMALCVRDGSNYLCMLNMRNDSINFLSCTMDLTMGFHSTAVVI